MAAFLKHAWFGVLVVLMPLFLSAPSRADWQRSGQWMPFTIDGHAVLRATGPGSLSPGNPEDLQEIQPTAQTTRLGVRLLAGRLDIVLREGVSGRVRVSIRSNGTIRGTYEAGGGPPAAFLPEQTIDGFEADRWYDLEISFVPPLCKKEAPTCLSVRVDGRLIGMRCLDVLLDDDGVRFESFAGSDVLIDVLADALDRLARAHSDVQLPGRVSAEGNRYESTNQDQRAILYRTLGRSPVLLEYQAISRPLTWVGRMVAAESGDQSHMPADVIRTLNWTGHEAFQAGDGTGRTIQRPVPALPQNPVIESVEPWELNFLNDPTDGVFVIRLRDEAPRGRFTVCIGDPTRVDNERRAFAIPVEPRPVRREGWRGSEITVDLREVVPQGVSPAVEGTIPLWVAREGEPWWSNRASVHLRSRWPSQAMLVVNTEGFAIRDDREGPPNSLPEMIWAFKGVAGNNETVVRFPGVTHGDVSVPWDDSVNVGPIGAEYFRRIPVFAARVDRIAGDDLLVMGSAIEMDGNTGSYLAGVAEALSAGAAVLKSVPIAGQVATALAAAATALHKAIDWDDDPIGVFATPYLAEEEPAYRDGAPGSFVPVHVDGPTGAVYAHVHTVSRIVPAPRLRSVRVELLGMMWERQDDHLDAPLRTMLRTDRAVPYVQARAAIGFEGNELRTGRYPFVITPPVEGLDPGVWHEFAPSDERVVLDLHYAGAGAPGDCPPVVPFLYLEFAAWDSGKREPLKDFGGAHTRLICFHEFEGRPDLQQVTLDNELIVLENLVGLRRLTLRYAVSWERVASIDRACAE
ncbi:MAG: hypothetical protein KF817_11025 [Phycisphaeraceae bacterium]|nr:hypothetical protein [Phycisphaeraceae bacterium]